LVAEQHYPSYKNLLNENRPQKKACCQQVFNFPHILFLTSFHRIFCYDHLYFNKQPGLRESTLIIMMIMI